MARRGACGLQHILLAPAPASLQPGLVLLMTRYRWLTPQTEAGSDSSKVTNFQMLFLGRSVDFQAQG